MLDLDIYGLRVRINFVDPDDEAGVTGLLRLFVRERSEKAYVGIDFRKKESSQEIGGLLFPFLAEQGIWAIHSGGFHYNGGRLTVGPSDCGKSTLSYMAMKNGLSLLSDDIALLRESSEGIEILPFYSTIFLRDRTVVPGLELFKPGALKCFFFPRAVRGPTCVEKMDKRIDLLKGLVPQFLWSYDRDIQERQKIFLEKLCGYPAFEVCWGRELFEDITVFREILDAVVQG